MENKIIIKAKDDAEALLLASKEFSKEAENIEIKLIKPAKKFLGNVIDKAEYECSIKQTESEAGVEKAVPENSIIDTDYSYDKRVENAKKEIEKASSDGEVSFIYTEDGVFINIKYSTGEGKPVTLEMVNKRIEFKKIRDVSVEAIKTILAERKTGGRIAEPQNEYQVDESISARFSLDKMIGYITFLPPDGGKKLEYDEFKKEVKKVGIVTGIDEEKLKEAFEEREYGKEYRVADGIPAIDGKDGKVTIKIDFKGEGKPEETEDGYVDYYSLGKFISVKEGEVLATYQKPTKGKSGRNVVGDFLKAKDGKGIRLPLGRNVMLAETGTEIVSKVEGVVEYVNGALNVDEVLVINGDVDLSTGNIEFNKNIKIRGSVRPRMLVKAGGSIEVDGIVDSANLEAGGKINIRGGVQGGGKGTITAGEEITAQYIENAIVYSDGDIISGSIVNSRVECAGYIDVKGQRASIIGGSVKSMFGINCQNAGSNSNIETNLEVGVLPKLKSRVQQLEKEVALLSKETRELKKVENLDDSALNTKQKIIKQKMLAEYQEKYAILNEKADELDSIRGMMSVNKESYISVADVANIGTNITINAVQLRLDSRCMNTTFKIVDGEIAYTVYTPPKKREKKN